jgi:hypothetical protein
MLLYDYCEVYQWSKMVAITDVPLVLTFDEEVRIYASCLTNRGPFWVYLNASPGQPHLEPSTKHDYPSFPCFPICHTHLYDSGCSE